LWPDHLRMTEAGFDLVDWWSVKRALDGFPDMIFIWASKHMSHFCGDSQMQKICSFCDHSKCQHCQQDNKMTSHVPLCQGEGADSNGRIGFCTLDFGCLKLMTNCSDP
jgi:hypothetical protein